MVVVFGFFSVIGGWGAAAPPFVCAITANEIVKMQGRTNSTRVGLNFMVTSNWISTVILPTHGRLIVDRSTPWGLTPAGTDVLTVFDDARHRRVAAGMREHFRAPGAIVLGVVLDERDAFGVVEVPRLLAIRASRFYINH